ncbi:hypothetical protein ACFY40_14370 [Streptomyces sp. NPDC012950]|uniref:hypothetical protein n=1 Tax=Streptomyces sp. NPDC012950 TaxID=3364858 RepID=UPI0036AA8F77
MSTTGERTTGEQAAVDGGTPVGRELSPGIVVLSKVVGGVSLTVGALLAATGLAGYAAGAWVSPEALSPGLLGAAMAGVAPALLTVGRARVWEEVRSLVLPLATVLVGLFAVSLLNGGSLRAAKGGPLFLVPFSLGWVATLGVLALGAVGCLVAQYRVRARPADAGRREPAAPLPGWSKPPLAVLGSGWLGIGAGLLASLAEDDLTRLRPALVAVPSVALAAAVVLAVHAPEVDWASGPGASLVALLAGLLATGVSGRWLLTRASRTTDG